MRKIRPLKIFSMSYFLAYVNRDKFNDFLLKVMEIVKSMPGNVKLNKYKMVELLETFNRVLWSNGILYFKLMID